MATGYSYAKIPLDPAKKEIRLLRFSNTNQIQPSEPLRCSLHRTSLSRFDEPSSPMDSSPEDPFVERAYYAISYAWGDNASKRAQICIDEVSVNVPENTERALRQLHRHKRLQRDDTVGSDDVSRPEDEIFLWIDAVCIDQGNLLERNQQVTVMGEVYRHAVEVLVPLRVPSRATQIVAAVRHVLAHCSRETDEFRGLAERLQRDVEEGYVVYFREDFIRFAPDLHGMALENPPSGAGKEGKGSMLYMTLEQKRLLEEVYTLPWFTRVWVIQEVALARKVTCYLNEIPLAVEDLLILASWLALDSTWNTSRGQACASQLRVIDCGSRLSHLIDNTRSFETTEPRDKIFALLGLLEDDDRQALSLIANVEPDYARNVSDVFRDATRAALEEAGDLTLLELARTGVSWEDGAHGDSVPSWVPRCDRTSSGMMAAFGMESFMLPMEIDRAYRDPDILAVRGFGTGEVVFTHECWPDHPQSWETSLEACSVRLAAALDSMLPALTRYRLLNCGLPFELALGVTLCCGNTGDNMDARTDETLAKAFGAFRQRSLSDCPGSKPKKAEIPFLRAFRDWGDGQVLFVTKEGHMGMSYPGIEVGDQTCFLFGDTNPYILHPDGDLWKLIGYGYLYGLPEASLPR